MTEYAFHPIADVFPMMTEAELMALAKDIKENGQREAIVLHEEQILDGRNRYKACRLIGVTPICRQHDGGDLVRFVVSKNLLRRHLNEGQRGVIAIDLATRTIGKRANSRISNGMSNDDAAELLNISPRTIQEAKFVRREAPQEIAAIVAGQKSLNEVVRSIKKAAISKRVATLPSDKFRVIYADPPWNYSDTQQQEGYGPAEAHYPTMSIADLCALDIPSIVEPNAVLFLWTTSPLLFECKPLITAWGFSYRTSFVWDKIKHNMGHYNSVRHEFLLVCVRGSCTPDVPKLFDSVQSIERTEHSEKPEEFRTIIDHLYPHGKRIELFARKKTKGWEVYGNEVVK